MPNGNATPLAVRFGELLRLSAANDECRIALARDSGSNRCAVLANGLKCARARKVDVVIIEGAVSTVESREIVERWRKRAKCLIAMGACAVCGGIPSIAAHHLDERAKSVYGDALPSACGEMLVPQPVSSVVDVDFEVRACPIDPADFVAVMQHAIYGSNATVQTGTLCGSCKRNESGCLWREGKVCLGLVTQEGCGAKCVQLGRECNGCRGLSANANLSAARAFAESTGVGAVRFDEALELFNLVNPMLSPISEGEE